MYEMRLVKCFNVKNSIDYLSLTCDVRAQSITPKMLTIKFDLLQDCPHCISLNALEEMSPIFLAY